MSMWEKYEARKYESAVSLNDSHCSLEGFSWDMNSFSESQLPTSWAELMRDSASLTIVGITSVFINLLPAAFIIGLVFQDNPIWGILLSAVFFAVTFWFGGRNELETNREDEADGRSIREAAESFAKRYPQLDAMRVEFEKMDDKIEREALSEVFSETLESIVESEREAVKSRVNRRVARKTNLPSLPAALPATQSNVVESFGQVSEVQDVVRS